MTIFHSLGTISRRGALFGLSIATLIGRARLAFAQAATDRRLVIVLLRGGMDGLSAVIPYGDAALAGLRAPLIPPLSGTPNGMLDLGGFFGLHPALAGVHGLYAANEVLPIHAVAGPHHSRSHFEAQDYMECGAPHRLASGWLNRVAENIPVRGAMDAAVAFGGGVPLLLRGTTPVSNWAPAAWAQATQDLYARLIAMHRDDPITGPAFIEGLKERGFTESVLAGTAPPPGGHGFVVLADRAGRMLASKDGPRLAALETEGWDTHGGQAPNIGFALRRLDQGLMALRTGLGDAWAKTVVVVMTEFGRTARINGTGGTDHGTASVVLLLGGAVAGGRIRADWPGLGPGRLFEDRDLQPTLELQSILKGVLAAHLGLNDRTIAAVFPESRATEPLRGLIRPA